jgi:hypothetical protein
VVIPNSAVTEGTIRALNYPHALEAIGAGELLDQMIRHAAPSSTAPGSACASTSGRFLWFRFPILDHPHYIVHRPQHL